MNEAPVVERNKAAELRQEFDLSFALPPPQALAEVEDLLAIRVEGDPYAIRLSDISGLVSGRKVVAVPGVMLDLLGLAGIRGAVVPVFGLASILGYTAANGPPRWMILCGAEPPIAMAFSDFEGFLRIPKSNLHSDENPRAARQFVNQIASTEGGIRAVIGIPLIVEKIRDRNGHQRPAKEQ